MSQVVSLNEARNLINKWAELFDAHAAPEIIYHYTAGEDFAIQFQDLLYRGLAGLKEHDQLKSVFFEERHLYYNFQVVDLGPPLTLETQMIWETHKTLPGTPSGEHLIADLRHRWKFTRRASDREPVFLHHELLELNYREGFAPLASDSSRLHTDASRVGMDQKSR